METMNSIVADTFDNLMSEGRMLVINGKKQTLSSKDVETAVKLLIPGELGKGSVQEGRQGLKDHAGQADWQQNLSVLSPDLNLVANSLLILQMKCLEIINQFLSLLSSFI